MNHITLYTDGACIGNPGPGGYGAVLLYNTATPNRQELSGGYRRTTNNRMEIMAVLAGLRYLKEPCRVTVYSDSRTSSTPCPRDGRSAGAPRDGRKATGRRP